MLFLLNHVRHSQGEQIGPIFAQRAIIFFNQYWTYITELDHIFVLPFAFWQIWVGLHFGPFFHERIWSPWLLSIAKTCKKQTQVSHTNQIDPLCAQAVSLKRDLQFYPRGKLATPFSDWPSAPLRKWWDFFAMNTTTEKMPPFRYNSFVQISHVIFFKSYFSSHMYIHNWQVRSVAQLYCQPTTYLRMEFSTLCKHNMLFSN
jgi:hypothetical protein